MYAATFAGIVCMFIYFTQAADNSCAVEKFVVSFQLILSALVSIIAILPAVQEHQPRSGKDYFFVFLLYFSLYTLQTCLKCLALVVEG